MLAPVVLLLLAGVVTSQNSAQAFVLQVCQQPAASVTITVSPSSPAALVDLTIPVVLWSRLRRPVVRMRGPKNASQARLSDAQIYSLERGEQRYAPCTVSMCDVFLFDNYMQPVTRHILGFRTRNLQLYINPPCV